MFDLHSLLMRFILNKKKEEVSLAVGQKVRLTGFKDLHVSSVLMSMGLVPGTIMRCEGKSPFGQTYRMSFRERSIALRGETLSKMTLEPIL